MAKRSLSIAELREQCQRFEQVVIARKLAAPAEIDLHRPGGPENEDSGPRGWLQFYGILRGLHTRGEAIVAAARSMDEMALADGKGLDVFANTPETVRCVGLAEESGKVYQVGPKGLGALMVCHERDELLQWLAVKVDFLQQRGTADDLVLIQRANEEILRNLALLAWVVTSPGKGVPWDRTQPVPEAPDEYRQLDLPDLLALYHAHLRVNGLRIEVVRRSMLGRRTLESEPGTTMLRWTTFVGHAAVEMKRRPEELMWDWSLAELLIAVAASVEVQRAAHEKAESAAGAGA